MVEKNVADALSRAERLALVDRSAREVAVTAQCELLSLHRSTVYYTPLPISEQGLLIKRRIDEIYTATPFYGIRKLTVSASGLNSPESAE